LGLGWDSKGRHEGPFSMVRGCLVAAGSPRRSETDWAALPPIARKPDPRAQPGQSPRQRQQHGPSPIWPGSVVAIVWRGSAPLRGIREAVAAASLRFEAHLEVNLRHAEALELEGSEAEHLGRYVEAAEYWQLALEERRRVFSDGHEELGQAFETFVCLCNGWALRYLASGQSTPALTLLKKAEAVTEPGFLQGFARRVAVRIQTFYNLCYYFRGRGKLNAALQFAEKAFTLKQRHKEAEDVEAFAALELSYAFLLSAVDRHKKSLAHVEATMATLFQEDVANMLVVAGFNAWAELWHLGQHPAAAEQARRCLDLARRRFGEAHPLTLRVNEGISSWQTAPPERSPRRQAEQQRRCSIEKEMAEIVAQKITCRIPSNSSKQPILGPLAEGATFKERLHGLEVQEHIYGRAKHHVSAEMNAAFFGSQRPKPNGAGAAYVGSATLQQQVHGTRPLSLGPKRAPGTARTQEGGERSEGGEEGRQDGPGPGRIHAIDLMRAEAGRRRTPASASGAPESNRAATRIQAHYRGHVTREVLAGCNGRPDSSRRAALEVVEIARWTLVEHTAATEMQRTWRGWRTRRRIEAEVVAVANESATRLQRLYRRRRQGDTR